MIIDIHAHFPWADYSHLDDVDVFLRRARRFHVDRVCLSGNVARYGFNPTARQVREVNRWTLRCMARHPEEIIGLCFINPAVGADAARREIDWAITRNGFRGIKLWVSVNCRSRKLDPVMTEAAERGVPVLQHASLSTLGPAAPNESAPADVAAFGSRAACFAARASEALPAATPRGSPARKGRFHQAKAELVREILPSNRQCKRGPSLLSLRASAASRGVSPCIRPKSNGHSEIPRLGRRGDLARNDNATQTRRIRVAGRQDRTVPNPA